MPRPPRPIAEGLIYHIITRGNNRQQVFFSEDDYQAFLDVLADLKQRKPFELYGYCLMANHIHLLLRPKEDTISRIVQSLLISHTLRYHRLHDSCGHVWQGRFRSPIIQDDEHLLAVLRYIEANPLRAKLVRDAGKYRWSSFAWHGRGRMDDLLDPIPAYEALGARPLVRQRRWSAYVHQRPDAEELFAIRRSSETGLPYGSSSWVRSLSRRLKLDFVIRPRGRPRKQTT